ncbi:hypothetical protein CP532_1700 [Ophiocordyceps camponoti-leonardi (nom. inval.)]|nr:hypothetical protein CP532_1700 [Ophiocordyceps camponoti-leonardi (nom. inval.)]
MSVERQIYIDGYRGRDGQRKARQWDGRKNQATMTHRKGSCGATSLPQQKRNDDGKALVASERAEMSTGAVSGRAAEAGAVDEAKKVIGTGALGRGVTRGKTLSQGMKGGEEEEEEEGKGKKAGYASGNDFSASAQGEAGRDQRCKRN